MGPIYTRAMTPQDLVTRAEQFAKRRGWSLGTVSGKILNDGHRLEELSNGSRMFPETLEAAAAKLAKLEAEYEAQHS